MINLKKLLALLLVVAMVAALFVGCKKSDNKEETNGTKAPTAAPTQSQTNAPSEAPSTEAPTEPAVPTEYQGYISELADGAYAAGDDEEIYEANLGKFAELAAAANAAVEPDERFVLFAQAEAELLDAAVMAPYSTQGGAFTLSRIAPRTVPYVQWGNDDDRIGRMVISADTFLTKEEREELLAQWADALAGNGTYDPAAYLTGKGHTLKTDYTTTFSTAPVTIDWLNTSSQSDTEITVNCVDGLVEYDNLGNMQPRLAESWDVSEDGLTYTFHLRDANWYTSEGAVYAPVTAGDFVAGFHHMMDVQAGLEYLVCQGGANIVGTDEYLAGGSFDDVGYKAIDDKTLEVTLTQPTSYFLTMLTYSCFLPICDSFYQSRGGVYGIDEYTAASADTNTYTFGKADDPASQVYCGPFLLQKLQKDSEIYIVKNPEYYGADTITMDWIKWVYDNGEDPVAAYNSTCDGTYSGIALGVANGTMAMAKEDGNFDKYAYVSNTTATTYFGALNLNRGTMALKNGACASPKTTAQQKDTATALNNKNFRKAVQHAFDKASWNAVTRGEDLASTNLRNMYTPPEFVKLENDVTDAEGHTFPAGTFYGEMVQYYCDQIGCLVDCRDGVNGWYKPEEAQDYLAEAKAELGDQVHWPIQIDVVYYSPSDNQTAQANAYKNSIEENLGAENVVVNLVEATTPEDFYACGYRAANGAAGNYDMFYGSGWGPDYGDPCTYLNIFDQAENGYMLKIVGLF